MQGSSRPPISTYVPSEGLSRPPISTYMPSERSSRPPMSQRIENEQNKGEQMNRQQQLIIQEQEQLRSRIEENARSETKLKDEMNRQQHMIKLEQEQLRARIEANARSEAKVKVETITMTEINPELSSLSAIKKSTISGNILNLKTDNDINNLMVDATFKLRVNLPNMPPYIKNQEYDIKKGINPNYFYLSVETLDGNCSITTTDGKCMKMYIDDKKCSNKRLSANSQMSKYRLVLISSTYVLDKNMLLGQNTDFTLVKLDDKIYLKNVNTGYMPTLFMDETTIPVYGNMNNNDQSNIKDIPNITTNAVCGEQIEAVNTNAKELYVGCLLKPDESMYLMTTQNIGESSPLKIEINKDGTINIKLNTYNRYGYLKESYLLSYCNFDIKTYKYIESVTIPNLATYFVNLVCFNSDKDENGSKNKLDFTVELNKVSNKYLENTSIYKVD